MGWLGLDDTDSLAGGCTTAVFHDLLNGLPASCSIGVPRLVRLWPFAQRRTRGNAALGVEVHTDDISGLLHHLDAWWNNHIVQLAGEVEVSDVSDRQQSPASPGMVWFADQPPVDLYGKDRCDGCDCLESRTMHLGGHRVENEWGGINSSSG